jgi:peptide methionine sulfoxide reductase MsrB
MNSATKRPEDGGYWDSYHRRGMFSCLGCGKLKPLSEKAAKCFGFGSAGWCFDCEQKEKRG